MRKGETKPRPGVLGRFENHSAAALGDTLQPLKNKTPLFTAYLLRSLDDYCYWNLAVFLRPICLTITVAVVLSYS